MSDPVSAERGYGFAYFHWHWFAWTSATPFSASNCRSCYTAFADMQRFAKLRRLSEGEGNETHAIPTRDLLAITSLLQSHPEWWDYPCFCADCRSYVHD